MSVNATSQSRGNFLNFFRRHAPFLFVLILVLLFGIYMVITRFQLPPVKELGTLFYLFGLSLQALVILWAISFYLLYRWWRGGRQNKVNLIMGLSFLVYSWVFIGTLLQSFVNPENGELLFFFADLNDPFWFFVFRQAHIWWAAGMWYACSLLLTTDRRLQILPSLGIIMVYYAWFVYGLLILKDTLVTMYGFLFLAWIPVNFVIAYMFFLYGRQSDLVSPKFLAAGFVTLGVIYGTWGPWRESGIYMYFIMFYIFILTLMVIFVGFFLIPWEREAKKMASTTT